jgi:putative acetyltransferase
LFVIKKSSAKDLKGLLEVENRAFGETEGPVIVKLVNDLLADPTAKPVLSMIALHQDQIVGHILFTNSVIKGYESIGSAILAPLAVDPDFQNQGLGSSLISEGLKILVASGVKLVFVLGHPDYYPRSGFKPAGRYGFEAPYPIPEAVEEAWMVQELNPGYIGSVKGSIICAEVLDRPEHWRE